MLAAHFTSADATTLPMLLLGRPGAGKSMLTKVLAARLPAEECAVVRVPLRGVPAGASISDQLQRALDIASNSRLRWQDLSDRTHTVLVVLLVGLDELPQAADFDRSGVDVPPGATVVKLEEFDDDQIAAWLREWRAAHLASIRTGVVRELTAAEALRHPHLARQPLLLLMLALCAADPQLPKLDADLSKAALYERIFDSFARREVRKPAVGASELESRVADQVFRLAVAALAMVNRGAQSVRENLRPCARGGEHHRARPGQRRLRRPIPGSHPQRRTAVRPAFASRSGCEGFHRRVRSGNVRRDAGE